MRAINPTRILIDLSHNERLTSFSENVFDPLQTVFSFNEPSGDLSDPEYMKRHNLVILGQPTPRSTPEEKLFSVREVMAIKKYVSEGGAVLVTSASRGDYNFSHTTGSLRILAPITGVRQFFYGILMNNKGENYVEKKYNLKIVPPSSIKLFETDTLNPIILAKATALVPDPTIKPTVLLKSPPNTVLHEYETEKNEPGDQLPLLITHQLGEGRVATIGSTQFLTDDPLVGVNAGGNKVFITKLCSWLIKKKIAPK